MNSTSGGTDRHRGGAGIRWAASRARRALGRIGSARPHIYAALFVALATLVWAAWRGGAVVEATIQQAARYEALTAWPMYQATLEVERFRAALSRHVAGEAGTSWEEVQERFEILWSRMPLVDTEVRVDIRLQGRTLAEIRAYAVETAALVDKLVEGRETAVGDVRLLAEVEALIRPLGDLLRHAAVDFHTSRRSFRDSTLDSVIGLGRRQSMVTLGFFAIVALLLVIAFAETFAARRAETKAQAVAAAARRAEQRFRHFADSASDWLWECDAELRLTFLSDRWRAIFGYTDALAVGRRWLDFAAEDADSPAWRQHLADLAERRPFRDFAFAHRTSDGEIRTAQLSAVPIIDADGSFAGYRGVGADISERLAQKRRIEFLARHDPMTGLLNRSMLHDELAEALRTAEERSLEVALLLIDLDGFKSVNDSLGHDTGDRLIAAVAARLREATRSRDALARVGGDEFAVLIGPKRALAGEAEAAAHRLLHDLQQPFMLDGHEVKVGASIGIALFPAHAGTGEALLKAADLALYRAKANGRRTFCLFTSELRDALTHRRTLERDLAEALRERALDVHFQPVLRLADDRLVGAEALARWQHPIHGSVTPDLFVPIAEETGLIRELGRFVLERACGEAAGWGGELADLSVSVNLSAAQFGDDSLIRIVGEVLASSGLAAHRLVLEITEAILMRDHASIRETLAGLRALGVQLAIDDFGSGYSSLSYLRMFPVDKLKLDRGFVRDLDGEAQRRELLRVIVMLGHSLGLTVVAEGVELDTQLAFLRQIGCDEAQGYLVGQPQPAGRFRGSAQLRSGPGWAAAVANRAQSLPAAVIASG